MKLENMSINIDSSPRRVQLKRVKGWKMPPNTIKVARPTRWGNPFRIEKYGRDMAVIRYRNWLSREIRKGAINLGELRGRNLACWCKPGLACHADVLIEMANSDESKNLEDGQE